MASSKSGRREPPSEGTPEWHKEAAFACLKKLHRGNAGYAALLNELEYHLLLAGLTLSDLGTSKVYLERYRVKGCAETARQYASRLRRGTPDYMKLERQLRAELNSANLSLEYIGLSEKDLQSYRVKGRQAAPATSIQRIRYRQE